MQLEFWNDVWREQDQPMFDQKTPNSLLLQTYSQWAPPAGSKIFVPLCGRSIDMSWIRAQGHAILGIECAESAVKSYFELHYHDYKLIPHFNAYTTYEADLCTILVGDFFHLDTKFTEDCLGCYDRASLVAMPAKMRIDYSQKMAQLMPPGSRTLLLTFEYETPDVIGPPFSVKALEIQDLYGANFQIKELQRIKTIPKNPKFLDAGIPSVSEVVTLLIRKSKTQIT